MRLGSGFGKTGQGEVKKIIQLLLVAFIAFGILRPMHEAWGKQERKAIVLAAFGTSHPSALEAITNIQRAVEQAFPGVGVRVAFTSNIIRNIWHKRRNDPRFSAERRFLEIKGPLATIADLQDEGYKSILVQPTHIYAGEEYMDLASYVKGLNSITTIKPKYKPFEKLVLGRPLLGTWGPRHDYHGDLKAVAEALGGDAREAEAAGAALVYMGHGNKFFPTGAYVEFQEVMRKAYPGIAVFVGTVEGFPSLGEVVSGLVHRKVRKVILRPFMIVAGDHARNDMAGEDEGSWKNEIAARGIRVQARIQGLGEKKTIADLFVRHIKETAADHHLTLSEE